MRIVHDTSGTHLQSLLPSCHVHKTASTSDARWSDVIVRVAQSEEDYNDVGHHRSSLLLRLAAYFVLLVGVVSSCLSVIFLLDV